MDKPKRTFGGAQEGAGRKPKPPEQSLHQVPIYVDYDTFQYLNTLPLQERKELKREAAAVLKRAAELHTDRKDERITDKCRI